MNPVNYELICANLCNLSYKNNVDEEYIKTCSDLGINIISDIQFVEAENAEGFVMINDETLYISIRGLDNINDIFNNANIILKPIFFNTVYCGRVHSGLYDNYLLTRDILLNHIETFVNNGGRHIIFTGHSSGASVSFLALECSFEFPGCHIDCYTFGSPKLGDCFFASIFNSRLSSVKRVYINTDVVPRLPFSKIYKHVGSPIYLSDNRIFSWAKIILSIITLLFNRTLFNQYIYHEHSLITYIAKIKSMEIKNLKKLKKL
jgi:predicted lipase